MERCTSVLLAIHLGTRFMDIGTGSTKPTSRMLTLKLTPEQVAQGKCWVRQVSISGKSYRLVRQDTDPDKQLYSLGTVRKKRTCPSSEINPMVKPMVKKAKGYSPLLELPNDLLALIFLHLVPSDIDSVSQSCRLFRTLVHSWYPDKTLFQEARKLCTKGYTLCSDTVAILHNLYRANKECLTAQKKHGISNETMVMALYNKYFAEALLQRLISEKKIQWVLKKEILNIPYCQLDSVQGQALLPGEKIACSCTDELTHESSITIYSLKSGQKLRTLMCDQSQVYVNSLLSLTNGLLVSGHTSGDLNVWNTETGELKKNLDKKHTLNVYSLVQISKDRFVSGGLRDGMIHIWNATDLSHVKKLTFKLKTGIETMVITHGGYLAVASKSDLNFFVYLVDIEKDKCIQTTRIEYIRQMVSLPHGYLAISLGHRIKIMNTESGKYLRSLERSTELSKRLTVIPGGFLAAVYNNGTIRIWSPETGHCRQTLNTKSADSTYDRVADYIHVMNDGSLLSGHIVSKKLKHWVIQPQEPAEASASTPPELQ